MLNVSEQKSEIQPITTSTDPLRLLKRWQLESGRTRRRLEEISSQLDTAVEAYKEADRLLGERSYNGEPGNEATLTQADETVRRLKSALKIAEQKEEAAKEALKEAQRQVAIEAQVDVVVRLKQVFKKGDAIFEALERWAVDDVGPVVNEARDILISSGIAEGELYFLVEIPGLLEQQLLLSVCSLIRKGSVPHGLRKYEKVSDVIPEPAFIRSRQRTGQPLAKPIPGWQQAES